jgi:hypothetical protein
MDQWTLPPGLSDLLMVMAVVSVVALVAALLLAALLWRRLRGLKTSGGGFWQTLREVPFGLVLLLDLLDLALDVFSAPLIWFLLRRLGLTALREVATVEALIPFTAPLPTMTFCWLLARLGMGDDARGKPAPVLQGERIGPGRWRAGTPTGGDSGTAPTSSARPSRPPLGR